MAIRQVQIRAEQNPSKQRIRSMTTDTRQEPSLPPSADSNSEKAEKVRSGKVVAAVLGFIILAFLLGYVAIIIGGTVMSLSHS
jgi:hypothetical protein